MNLHERFQLVRPLDEMEISLVRALVHAPDLLSPPEELTLRTALSLARLQHVRHDGEEVRIDGPLAPFRDALTRQLAPLLGRPSREALAPLVAPVRELTLRTRDEVIRQALPRLPADAIHREICEKALVIVSGGGGGTGYVYLGVMSQLEELGLRPRLLVGTSMGAVLSLFRSRMPHFNRTEIVNIVRGLSWKKLFRFISTESRYGVPAAARLFLRAGIGRFFEAGPEASGAGLKLNELPIPTLIVVGGILRGMLPRPVEFYERLLGAPASLRNPATVARKVQRVMGALAEIFTRPEITVPLTLGADPVTASFDALDAAGFSCALPGVVHYDVLREDPAMRALLDGLFEERGLFRLIDGGLVDNLPAKAAWTAVQRGAIGTRNAFILGLNAFAPRLSTPLWLPLQRLAAMTVAPNLPYAHLVKEFRATLSPLEVVPSVKLASQAIDLGRAQLAPELPFLAKILAPLPILS